MKNFNYNDYDKIVVTTKLDMEKQVTLDYSAFGWKRVCRREDRLYFDAVHLTFIREHKILKKDDVQIMQVYYENYFNELCECEDKRKYRSNAFLTGAVSILALILLGAVILLFSPLIVLKILGVIAMLLLLVGIGLTKRYYSIFNKKNIENTKKKKAVLQDKINFILSKAKQMTGVKNEK